MTDEMKKEPILGIQKPTGNPSLTMVMISLEEYDLRIATAKLETAKEILAFIEDFVIYTMDKDDEEWGAFGDLLDSFRKKYEVEG